MSIVRIRWTEPAVADLQHISEYTLSTSGLERANKTCRLIVQAVEGLERYPYQGKRVRANIRKLVIIGIPFTVV